MSSLASSSIDRSNICAITQDVLLDKGLTHFDKCTLCEVPVGYHGLPPSPASVVSPSAVPVDALKGLVIGGGRSVDVPVWRQGEWLSVVPFLSKFESLCLAEAVPEQRWPSLLLKSVTAPAEIDWVRKTIVEPRLSWADAKEKFSVHFEKHSYKKELLLDWHRCRQGKNETVQAYSDRFQHLCSQLNYSDSEPFVISQYELNLLPSFQKEVERHFLVIDTLDPSGEKTLVFRSSLSSFIGFCMKVDAALLQSAGPSPLRAAGSSSNNQSASSDSPSSPSRGGKQKWCPHHRSRAHDASECRKRRESSSPVRPASSAPQPSSSSSSSKPPSQPLLTRDGMLVKCRICSGNHYPDKCTSPLKDSHERIGVQTRAQAAALSSSGSSSSASSSSDAGGVSGKAAVLVTDSLFSSPRADGKKSVFAALGDGHLYSVLMDSGATWSFIDEKLVASLKLPIQPLPGNNATVELALKGGTPQKCGGYVEIAKAEFLFPCSDRRAQSFEDHRFVVGCLRDAQSSDSDPHIIVGSELLPRCFPQEKGHLPPEYMPSPAPLMSSLSSTHLATPPALRSIAVTSSLSAAKEPEDPSLGSPEDDIMSPSSSLEHSDRTAVSTPEELECSYAPRRDHLMSLLADCLAINSQITGFCTLPGSEVVLSLRPDFDLSKLYRRQYRIPHHLRELADPIVQRWFDTGRIELVAPGCRYNNAMTVVPKKDDAGQLTGARPCLDSRFINQALVWTDSFQIPRIRDSFDILAGCSIFGTVDGQDAYLQLPVHADSRPLLAFTWNDKQYQFVGAPFGLAPLTSHFQRCMSLIFRDMPFVMIYVDNIVWGSHSWDEHTLHCRAVIERLTFYNVRIKPSSIQLGHAQLQCLGHIINVRGVATDPSKIRAIQDWPRPTTPKELQSFLGFCGFLRAHIRHYADITAPLEAAKLLPALEWTPEMLSSFDVLKLAFSHAAVLSFPDFSRPFHIATDASQTGVGGVLFQPSSDEEHITPTNIVAICSKKLDPTRRRWPAYKKELFGVVYCLREFHFYVYGRSDLVVHTDHKPLTHMFESAELSPALQMWLDVLLDYTFTIRHRDGILNVLPDALSRMYGAAYSQTPIWGAQAVLPSSPLDPITVRSLDLHSLDLLPSLGEGALDPGASPSNSSSSDAQRSPFPGHSAVDLAIELEKRGKRAPQDQAECECLINDVHRVGHFGVEATYRKLFNDGWWWPRMRQDINSLIKECDACARFTVVSAGFHPAQAITALGPWDHVQMDTSVHLPPSPEGFTALLVLLCVFAGFIILLPLKDTRAVTLAHAVYPIFCLFGFPKILQSDNGPEFSNEVMEALVKLCGVEHRFISPYNPRADGKVERSIGTVTSIIKKMLHGTSHHWPLFVEFAQLSFNQKISSLTGSSPFALMFGRSLNPMKDYSSSSEEYMLIDLEDWRKHQEKILSLVYPAISDRIKSGKDKMIQTLNKTRKLLLPSSLPSGSTVMLRDPLRANKFEPKYVGPYTIVRRARNGAYVLKDATGDLLDRHVPLDQLKVLKRGFERRKIDQAAEIFEVDSILSHRGSPGSYEYLVHWKDYSSEEDSWEPSSSFQDAKVIEKYWQNARGTSPHNVGHTA